MIQGVTQVLMMKKIKNVITKLKAMEKQSKDGLISESQLKSALRPVIPRTVRKQIDFDNLELSEDGIMDLIANFNPEAADLIEVLSDELMEA